MNRFSPRALARAWYSAWLRVSRTVVGAALGWRGGRALVKRLAAEVLPALPGRRGLSGAHLLESAPTDSTPQTAEQRIRGGDAQADWLVLVGGYDDDVVRAATAGGLDLPGAVEGLYRLAYSMTSKDLPR